MSGGKRTFVVAVAAAILILLIFAVPWPFWPQSAVSVGIRWVVTGFTIAIVAIWGLTKSALPANAAEYVQTVSAFFTMAAILVAGGMYFLERRNQAQLKIGLEANVVRPTTGDNGVDGVLLFINIPVENRGQRNIRIMCMGIDVMAPRPGQPLRRSEATREEMQLPSLSERIPYDTPITRECNKAAAHPSPRS